ncbi:hypothetical protein [Acinetobacter sp. P8-3-8]|nr:hypothetical protein [Acinetobacter sp. P8-3-8]
MTTQFLVGVLFVISDHLNAFLLIEVTAVQISLIQGIDILE